MSFNTRLDQLFPGTGVSLRSDSTNLLAGIALSTTGAVANTIPASGTLTPAFGVVAGRIRVKVYAGAGTSPALAALAIKVSDGTNTVTVAEFNPAVAVTLSSTSWYDGVFIFLIDVGSTSGGATGQMISNTTTPQIGATTVIVTTTLSGTTPTATMDVEVVPLVG
jgi:hypothetical protein